MDIKVTFDGNKKVNAAFNGFTIHTDQPIISGGEETAPTPFDLFLASFATCAGIYVKGFCDNRNLPTDKIKLFQDVVYNKTSKLVTKINIEIQLPENFPEKYHEALITVAGKCKVKQQMFCPPEVSVTTKVLN